MLQIEHSCYFIRYFLIVDVGIFFSHFVPFFCKSYDLLMCEWKKK